MTDPESTAIDSVAAMATDHTEAPAHPLHKVLSFARRSGRLDDRLQRAWDNYAGTYLLDIAAGNLLDVREGVTLDRAFVESAWGNDNPLIVEIGTGQGENVVAAAAAHPETNFLALEVYDPGVAHTLLLAGKQGLTNIRVAQVNAPELFKVTAAGTVAEVWTFFPDPWPKKKHHKRRIVQEAMAGDIHRALAADGVWRIATDIEDYALARARGDGRAQRLEEPGQRNRQPAAGARGQGQCRHGRRYAARRLHRIRAIRGPRAHQLREEGPGRRPRDS